MTKLPVPDGNHSWLEDATTVALPTRAQDTLLTIISTANRLHLAYSREHPGFHADTHFKFLEQNDYQVKMASSSGNSAQLL